MNHLFKNSLILIFFTTLFCRCAENTTVEKPQTDSIKTPETIVPKIDCDSVFPAEKLKTSGLKRWIDFYKDQHSTFDLNNFKFEGCTNEKSSMINEFEPSKEYLDLYKTLLVYAPDSSAFIDMDSYNFFLERDKKGNLIGMGGDPETEVALINLNDHTHTRLMYVGTTTIIEDVQWINKTKVVIVYLEADNENVYYPNIIIIDLNTSQSSLFKSSTKIDENSIHNYLYKVRRKSIRIKE